MIAFLPTLGFQEMVVLLLLGIILFGRNLPDVGRTLGRTVAQLRRGMQDFKDQVARDESMRDLRQTVQQTRQEIARAGTVPRALADPAGALRDAADAAIAAATNDEAAAKPAGGEASPTAASPKPDEPTLPTQSLGGPS